MTETLEQLIGGITRQDPSSVELGLQTILIFGDAGTGKTTLAADFPDHFFVDTESGAKNRAISTAKNPVKTWARFRDIVTALEQLPKDIPFKTLIVDTVDGLWKLCRTHCHAEMIAAGEDPETAKWGRKYTVPREEFQRTIDKLLWLHDKGFMGTVLIAHEHKETIVTPMKEIIKFRPQVDDNHHREELPKSMQMVLWARRLDQHPLTMDKWDRQRFLLQSAVLDVDSVVKDRSNRLPALVPMDYASLEKAYTTKPKTQTNKGK